MKRLFLSLINFYQKYISPLKGPSCRFHPTCSTYSKQAIERFGVLKGLILTIVRISKCHPFHPGGIDLVPEKQRKKDIQINHEGDDISEAKN